VTILDFGSWIDPVRADFDKKEAPPALTGAASSFTTIRTEK